MRFDGPYPGHPPRGSEQDLNRTYVVLIGRFGWITGKWARSTNCFRDMESDLPDYLRLHHLEDIEWWMPQSGSMKY